MSTAEKYPNPMGTRGFSFIEFASPEPGGLDRLFRTLGFARLDHDLDEGVIHYRQGEIDFLVNTRQGCQADTFAKVHGPSVPAFAFEVENASAAHRRALELGARQGEGETLRYPAIEGIGGSLLYLVDRSLQPEQMALSEMARGGAGLIRVDHLTNNVHRGHMDEWADFYVRLFGFRQIRYFDIHGKLTGIHSRAMGSPCGNIRIPVNESADDSSQVEEFIRDYHGEGVQHIALSTADIHATVQHLRGRGLEFMDVPDTYYEMVDERVPGHGEDLSRLREDRILIDGNPNKGEGLLLQIFTTTVIGPVFFEFIQRKGNEGFGEGNFQALFEAIERDQIQRGVLKV